MRGLKEWVVRPGWPSQALSGLTEERFLAEGEWSWAFFSRQPGRKWAVQGVPRQEAWLSACKPPASLPNTTATTSTPSASATMTMPPPLRLSVRSRSIHRQPCMFPVFIPLRVHSLFAVQLLYSTGQVSCSVGTLPHQSLTLKSPEKLCLCALLAREKWDGNYLLTDGVRYDFEVCFAYPWLQLGFVRFQRQQVVLIGKMCLIRSVPSVF